MAEKTLYDVNLDIAVLTELGETLCTIHTMGWFFKDLERSVLSPYKHRQITTQLPLVANGINAIYFQGVRRRVHLEKQPLRIQLDVYCLLKVIQNALEVPF